MIGKFGEVPPATALQSFTCKVEHSHRACNCQPLQTQRRERRGRQITFDKHTESRERASNGQSQAGDKSLIVWLSKHDSRICFLETALVSKVERWRLAR